MSTANSHNDPRQEDRGQVLDPLATVRRHPEWYFRHGQFDRHEATGRVLAEAMRGGAVDVTIRTRDDWIIVSADTDWLDGDIAAFLSPQVDESGGVNSSRVEVALVAFCDAVVTRTPNDRVWAWPASPSEPFDEDQWPVTTGRVVAFLPPSDTDEGIEDQASSSTSRRSRLRLVTSGGEEQITTAVHSFARKQPGLKS